MESEQSGFQNLRTNLPILAFRSLENEPWEVSWVSSTCLAVTGYPAERFLCAGFWKSLVHPDDQERVERLVDDSLQARESVEVFYRLLHAHGHEPLVCLQGFGFQTDSGAWILEGILFDLTALKQVEDKALRSEAKFGAIFKRSPQAMVITDQDTNRILEVNDEYVRLTGFTEAELRGKTSIDLGIFADPARVMELRDKIRTEGLFHDLELVVGQKQGVPRVTLCSGTSIEMSGKSCNVFLLADITEQRKAEKERAALEAQLQQNQRLEALGHLAGGIAHDINNILTGILANAELGKLQLQQPPKLEIRFDEVMKAALRGRDIVRQILTFSRQEVSERRPLDLRVVVEEAVGLLASGLPQTIQIETTLDPSTPGILADQTHIHQIVMNLGTNAVQALSESGGRISIRLGRIGRNVQLSVSDNGVGMDAETVQHIFEPFFTTKPAGKGTGLGLSVVDSLVKNHQGKLLVETLPGHGTTMNIEFPAYAGVEHTPPLPDKEFLKGHGERILFLDDETAITESMAELLGLLGYKVSIQNDPLRALEIFHSDAQDFDLVITDLKMPQMSGIELAEKVHRLRPDLPILLTSGYTGHLSLEDLKTQGILGIVAKPIMLIELAQAVRKALEA